MKHPPILGGAFVAVLAPAALSQVNEHFVPEHPSYLRGLLGQSAALVESEYGDFDGDGRMDIAVRGDDGSLAILFSHGDRQLALQPVVVDSQSQPVAVDHIAVLRRDDGHDSLYVATPNDVQLLDFEDAYDAPTATTVLTQTVTALHYGHEPGHMWGGLWIGLPASGSTPERVQPIITSPSTGLVLLALPTIAVASGVGKTCAIDVDDDGLYELAVTLSGGVVIVDGTGTPLSSSLRQVTGSTVATDRLAVLCDGDGSQHLVWSEVAETSGRLHVFESSGVDVIAYTPDHGGPIVAVEADGNGRADLLVPGPDGEAFRVLLADTSPTKARFAPGSNETIAELYPGQVLSTASESAVAIDLERDSDPDVLVVTGAAVNQLRNALVDHTAYWPDLQDVGGGHVVNDVATLPFAAPAIAGYDVARARVYGHSSEAGRLERVQGGVALTDVATTSGAFEFQFTLPTLSNPGRDVWYFEIEMVKLGGSGQPDLVRPSMVLGLSANDEPWISHRIAPGDIGDLEKLWTLPVYELTVADGGSTHGAVGTPVIPRLPPPPMPPAPEN